MRAQSAGCWGTVERLLTGNVTTGDRLSGVFGREIAQRGMPLLCDETIDQRGPSCLDLPLNADGGAPPTHEATIRAPR